MGDVRFIPRGDVVAQQSGRQRAYATDVSAAVSRIAALVARWQEDCVFLVRFERRQTGSDLRDIVRWRCASTTSAERSQPATGSKLLARRNEDYLRGRVE